MNYRTVSAKTIVETVFSRYRNYISQDSDGLVGNAVEWMGEALEAIGILSAMEDIDAVYAVENGRVEIPCNLYLIKSVAHDGTWLPYGSQTFNYDLHCTDCVNEKQAKDLPYSYIVNPNWIQTNVPEGETICISYKAFAVDEEGYPQIPDKVTVKQALFWYITMLMCLGGFQHPEINFDKAEQRWLKYCGQAEADLALLDKPQRETFRNQWVRLISTTQHDYRDFFSNIEGEVLQQKYNNQRV
jgi:hypothetical protein